MTFPSSPKTAKSPIAAGDELNQLFADGKTGCSTSKEKSEQQSQAASSARPADASRSNSAPQVRPNDTISLKRSISATDMPDSTSSAITKKPKTPSPPSPSTANDIIEPRGLVDILISEKATFLQLSGPICINPSQLRTLRNDVAEFHPLAVRAESSAYYVIFDSEKKDCVINGSDRLRCISRVGSLIQQKERSEVGIEEIRTMSSWKKGVLVRAEHEHRMLNWQKTYD